VLRLTGLPHLARFPEATVTRDEEKILIRFDGLGNEQIRSIPLKYVGAEDEEAAELGLLAQLQQIGYRVRRGQPDS
jgi:sorbitol-specific phosphotransferase system component IIA